jgi:hypothetical protein
MSEYALRIHGVGLAKLAGIDVKIMTLFTTRITEAIQGQLIMRF